MAKRFRNAAGPAIRKQREALGLTQGQLAGRLGSAGLHHFDRVAVAKVEGQIRSLFDYELAIFAKLLKVEPADLLPAHKALTADLPSLIEGEK